MPMNAGDDAGKKHREVFIKDYVVEERWEKWIRWLLTIAFVYFGGQIVYYLWRGL